MAQTNRLILLADDHVIIRRGLKLLLDNHFGREELIEAETTKEILQALENNPITHMILDMQLTDTNVIEILPEIKTRFPHIPILIYTMSSEDVYGKRMLDLGADGFLSKQHDEQEVIKALQLFLSNQKYLSPHLFDIINDPKHKGTNPLSTLSERELSVLSRLMNGESVKEISANLNIKATTVATYKARIFEKLNVNNILDLKNVTELYQNQIQ